jgi:hypothetical protein
VATVGHLGGDGENGGVQARVDGADDRG